VKGWTGTLEVIELAHTDLERAQLWDRFHALVNMPSPDLRTWLGPIRTRMTTGGGAR
jgi:hypothetical protein